MLKDIKAWFRRQTNLRYQSQFEDGFDFAAGALLAGESPANVALQAGDDPFDTGMRAAIRKWCELMREPLPLSCR